MKHSLSTPSPKSNSSTETSILTPSPGFLHNLDMNIIETMQLVITPQLISDFDHAARERRMKLTLFTHPIKVIQLIFSGCIYLISSIIQYLLSHQFFLFFIFPICISYICLLVLPGSHHMIIDKIQFSLEFIIWWLGLGILSSIGLGSGLQSGVLFMFPHIFRVVLTANTCKTLDFDSNSNMWFRQPDTLFQCPLEVTSTSTPVTFYGLWMKVILILFLQSTGTAIGEIPPYWITRAARLSTIEANRQYYGNTSNKYEDFEIMPEELETKNTQEKWMNQFKLWMISLLQRHGFYGVLLMASFPNLGMYDMYSN